MCICDIILINTEFADTSLYKTDDKRMSIHAHSRGSFLAFKA